MPESFLYRFKVLLDALMAHPRVRVTHVWIGPPARPDALAKLSEAWSSPVPEAVAALYRQADGVKLRWIDTAHATYDPERDDAPSYSDVDILEARGCPSGIINLPSLEELVERHPIGDQFDGAEDFLERAVVFEPRSESEDTVIYFGYGREDPWIGNSQDYQADVEPPGEHTLSEYLDHLLRSFGSVWHRYREPPASLDELLFERVALDPTRLVGQRVMYCDGGRGGCLMRGRVITLVEPSSLPRHWDFATTLAEISDDLGDSLYVPTRCLYPPDEADQYERLHADPPRLRRVLEGDAGSMFEALGAVAWSHGRYGINGGPCIGGDAWAYLALTSVLPGREAFSALLAAVETLEGAPDFHAPRARHWPSTRPNGPHRDQSSLAGLSSSLLDAALLHAARAKPPRLVEWASAGDIRRLRRILDRAAKSNPLRGYDPLSDASKPVGFLARALRGHPVEFSIESDQIRRGASYGLADLRVVESFDVHPPRRRPSS